MLEGKECSCLTHDAVGDLPCPCTNEKTTKPQIDDIQEQPCPTLSKETASEPVNELDSEERIPWTVKIPALACILFFTRKSSQSLPRRQY